jgi:predicted HTH transcriptional regulator
MSKNYIQNLITQGEHQQLDFKFEISDSRKIAKSLVAFANTDGGKLLIGVKDNGNITGIRSDEEKYMVETAAQLYTKPVVNYTVREWEINKKTVLEVSIPRSEVIPHYVKESGNQWMVYIRVKDQNLLANNVLLKVWGKKKEKDGVILKYTHPEKFLLKYLERYGTITMERYRELAKLPRNTAEDILVNFIIMNIIEIIFTEKETFYRIKEGFNV